MIFVPSSSQGLCAEQMSLSRNASFEGPPCRCGRECGVSLSSYVFSMELEVSLTMGSCGNTYDTSASTTDLETAAEGLSMGGEEPNEQQLAGRNCEGGNEASVGQDQRGHSGEHSRDWFEHTSSLRRSLARCDGEYNDKMLKGLQGVGCDSWVGGYNSYEATWPGWGEGALIRSFSQTPMSALNFRNAFQDDAA